MDFTFTEEQQMMAAAFRELAAEICAPSVLRAVFEARDQRSEERWSRLAELGLFGVRVAGGARRAWVWSDADFVLLAEEAGRAALPEPLIEQAALAVPALRGAGGRTRRRGAAARNWPAAGCASRWRTRRIRARLRHRA